MEAFSYLAALTGDEEKAAQAASSAGFAYGSRGHRPRHRHRLPRRQVRRGDGPPARGRRHGAYHHVPRHRLHRSTGPHRLRGLHPHRSLTGPSDQVL